MFSLGPFSPGPSNALGSHLVAVPPLWYTPGMADQLPALSVQDDTFALAVIEFGGNLGAAYRQAYGDDTVNPGAKARELITRPEIAKRINQIITATQEGALISLGSHLQVLAELRDLSITKGEMKVALNAEVKRGEAAGFYNKAEKASGDQQRPQVVINLGSTPANIADWSEKFGKGAPLVIDVPSP